MVRKARESNPKYLEKARRIAAQYQIIVEPSPGVGYVGRCVQLPGVMADGKSRTDCIKFMSFAIETVVAYMLEDGETPPAPKAAKRTEQVNVRLTALEKQLLEQSAEDSGFKSLSDFVRAAALNSAQN